MFVPVRNTGTCYGYSYVRRIRLEIQRKRYVLGRRSLPKSFTPCAAFATDLRQNRRVIIPPGRAYTCTPLNARNGYRRNNRPNRRDKYEIRSVRVVRTRRVAGPLILRQRRVSFSWSALGPTAQSPPFRFAPYASGGDRRIRRSKLRTQFIVRGRYDIARIRRIDCVGS